MMIHCALSAQHIHKYAKGSPYVYCGDFNIKVSQAPHAPLMPTRTVLTTRLSLPSHS